MADEFDDLRAKYGAGPAKSSGDDFDDLRQKYGVTPAAPARDVHAMARAEAGSPSGPRDLTSEEAGTSAGPISTRSPLSPSFRRGPMVTEQTPEPAAPAETDYTRVTERFPGTGYRPGLPGEHGPAKTITVGSNPSEMADPGVQLGTATAMGMAAGAPAALLPAKVAAVVGPAVETGVANKALGGDFTTGAALGAAIPALPYLAKAGKAAGRAIGENMEGGAVKEINRGRTKATGRLANDVKFQGREDGGSLTEVMHQVPEVRKAILTEAHTNPAGAAETLGKHIDAATDANSADFAAIQKQHGGVSLQPITDRLEALEGRLNRQGLGVSADAVGRVHADLLKRYGKDIQSSEATEAEAAALKAAEKRMIALREKAAAARASADEAGGAAPDRDLFEEARKIDAPQGREPTLLESARAIDAPVTPRAAADAGRAEVAEARRTETAAADAARGNASSAEAQAAKLERMAAKAERDYNRLITAKKDPVDVKLSAQQIRNIRNDMGSIADPARIIKPNTRRQAMAKIHGIMNKEIEDVAAVTHGVDVDALAARNRQISTLIPVRDALAQRAEKLADRDIGIGKRAKEAIGDAAAKAKRKVKYGLSSFPEANPAPPAYAGPTPFPDALPPVESPAVPFITPPVDLRRRRELEALGIAGARADRDRPSLFPGMLVPAQ